MATIITPDLLQEELTLHDLILPETVWNVIAFELEQVQKSGRPFRNTLALTGTGGLGKAQPLDSLVLTPNGFARMGDLKVNDEVVDPENGDKSFIEAIYPRGEMDVYRISFSDGSSCEATMDHLWRARTDTDTNSWKVMTTEQMLIHRNNNGKTRKKTIAIPLITPSLDGNENSKNLLIPPYIMGLLLGDGCFSHCISYTSADEELHRAIGAWAKSNDLVYKQHDDITYRLSHLEGPQQDLDGKIKLSRLNTELDRLGLYNAKSWNKFIPKEYLTSSESSRLAVLQGLLDSDGSPTDDGIIEFSSCSEILAKQVLDLARSFGFRATLRHRNTAYTYNGKKKSGRIAYRVFISNVSNVPLFRLTRHLERVQKFKSNSKLGRRSLPVKYLRDIEFIGRKQVQCIKVSARSSLYVTNDYTVTHNTSLGLAIARQLDMAKVIIVTNRPSKTEVREILSEIEDETMLLLDEIHGYARQEWLLDVCYGARGLGRKVNFTVFGATTNRGQLPQTVFSRFPIKLFLTYTREEEALIADKVAERFSVTLSMSEKDTLLKAANGNPRTMETILGFWPIGEPEKAVEMAQLTPDGLDADCLALLEYLDSKRDPVGRETLSRVLEAPGGIADIETILSRRKLIEPTPRGLKITTRGAKRMKYRRDTGI